MSIGATPHRPGRDPADPHLHAYDHVPVLAAAGHRLAGVAEQDLAAFADHDVAREAVDAGERDVEIGDDAAARALDDVVPEAGEVAWAGAAGIDEGGGAAAAGQRVGIDAQRSAAPVDMGMEVDQPRHDDPAAGIDDVLGALDRQARLDRHHATVAEADVELPIDPGTGIDDPSMADDEIEQT